ncbi:MAG: aldose 1-epimerase [Acidobacteria bacterium]|nr:aldose 1-epimerase [Acidobacteriota bacterium]
MPQATTDPLELQAGTAILHVSPAAGGSITRYASAHDGRTVEWMRPALPDAIRTRSAGSTSSFPLVPFSNRVRDAAFRFRGRTIQLAATAPAPHALHGHGWRQPWSVVSQTASGLALEYRHAADAWPWNYRAEQHFDLTAERLTVRFVVTNESQDPMPVGFGVHPYYVRTPRVRFRAGVGQMWRTDANAMPTDLVAPPTDLPFGGTGLSPDATVLDNNFLGFGGRARVEWPEWNAALEIVSDPVYSCLVIYTPEGRDFFCAEPVTNCIDAFNLADQGRTDTGLIVLDPGDTAAGDVRFTPLLGL